MKARALPAAAAAVAAWPRCPTPRSRSSRGAACTTCARSPSMPTTPRSSSQGRTAPSSGCPASGLLETDDDDDARALRDQLRDADDRRTSVDLEGVWVEPKTFGFGIHTRVASAEDAQTRVTPPIGSSPSARRTGVVAPGTTSSSTPFRHEGKDSALAALRERRAPPPSCSPATTSPTRTRWRASAPDDLGIRVGDGRDGRVGACGKHPGIGGRAEACWRGCGADARGNRLRGCLQASDVNIFASRSTSNPEAASSPTGSRPPHRAECSARSAWATPTGTSPRSASRRAGTRSLPAT